jgi:hypothetical protein
VSRLFVECQRCGGSGSVEASQSEDGRFSYQDQCPECSSWGVVPLSEPSEEMVERAWDAYGQKLSMRDALTAALFSSDAVAGEREETG